MKISCVFAINFVFQNCLPFYLRACRHAFDVEGCNWKPFSDLKLNAFVETDICLALRC